MRLLGLLLLGFVLAMLESEWAGLRWVPGVTALVLSFVLLRLEGPRLGLKVVVLVTGCAAGSALPLGAWWLAAGLAALPSIGMRGLLFVRHPAIQALAAGWTAACFLFAAYLAALLGTAGTPTGNGWWTVAITAVAGPVAHPLLEGLARVLPGRTLPPFPRDGGILAARMLE